MFVIPWDTRIGIAVTSVALIITIGTFTFLEVIFDGFTGDFFGGFAIFVDYGTEGFVVHVARCVLLGQ
jgi:hypothetical protein